ncbi:MAG: MBL fold metallo-hydrolase [Planctomycetaceae bacterium]|nr:MBL fold metallo-hydrolase [Planctomycetaceae bacterium]
MQIEFLGTGGYHPSERRHTLCLLLPETGVMFDAGTAAFRLNEAVQSGRVTTRHLQIFLTHAHLDHIAGLTFLLPLTLGGDLDSITVHGLPQVLQAVQEHLYDEALFPVPPDFIWQPLDGAVRLPDGSQLTYYPLEHPGGSLAYRIDWPDRSLALVTDTTASSSPPYGEFIQGVDLLIHECYFPDELADWATRTGHSNSSPVAETARSCQAGRLALVHTDPRRTDDDPVGLAGIRSIFPAVELPEDGAVLEF